MAKPKAGFIKHTVPFAPVLPLPVGYGVTKIDPAGVVEFFADYYTPDGDPAPLHDVEFTERGGLWCANNLTTQAERHARQTARGLALLNGELDA